MAVLSPPPKLQFFDANGNPLVGGKLLSYVAGTTTPLATYTDSSGLVANPNPTILDARGEAGVWLSPAQPYKLRLTTAADVEIWTVDNIGQADSSVLSQLAASGGSALIGYTYGASPAVPRTVQAALRDRISVKDFGAVGNDSTDDTVAIQAAIDAAVTAAAARGTFAGEVYFPNAKYRITGTLRLGIGVHLNLNGSYIRQATNNIPIISCPTGSDIYHWSVFDGGLEFVTPQTSAQTSGVGIMLSNGNLSYNFNVRDVQVNYACDGIVSTNAANTFAFVGYLEHIICVGCARWGMNISCDTTRGANTNLTFTNCWAIQVIGSEISTSRGFRFIGLSQGRWESLFADHIQGQFLEMESCVGQMGCITPESCDFNSTAQAVTVMSFANCDLTIDSVRFIDNAYTVGANDIYMARTSSSGPKFRVTFTNWLASGNTYSGTLANLYEINAGANVVVSNEKIGVDRTPNYADFSLPVSIDRLNGVERTSTDLTGRVVYAASAPTTGTWALGDRCISTDISPTKLVVEWVCVVAGAAALGNWRPCRTVMGVGTTAARPAGLNLSHFGVQYLDQTIGVNGVLITWNGAAWVNSTGVVV